LERSQGTISKKKGGILLRQLELLERYEKKRKRDSSGKKCIHEVSSDECAKKKMVHTSDGRTSCKKGSKNGPVKKGGRATIRRKEKEI